MEEGLPGWVVTALILLSVPVVAYLLVCVFLAVYLWFNPIVFQVVEMKVSRKDLGWVSDVEGGSPALLRSEDDGWE